MHARLLAAGIALSALFGPVAALAQTADKPPQAYRLEPKKVPDIASGRASMVRGTTAKGAHRYYLEHLHMMVPVVVTLRPLTREADLKLEIGKYPWEPAERQGQVRNGEQVSFSFRTQGEFQIAVSSAQAGTPYKLLVWVGDEIKPALTPVIVPASQYSESGGGWTRHWPWLAGTLVVLGLVVAGWFLGRRKQA